MALVGGKVRVWLQDAKQLRLFSTHIFCALKSNNAVLVHFNKVEPHVSAHFKVSFACTAERTAANKKHCLNITQ